MLPEFIYCSVTFPLINDKVTQRNSQAIARKINLNLSVFAMLIHNIYIYIYIDRLSKQF